MEQNYVEIFYPNYEEWRKGHQKFLGGASASCILGVNKYKNLLQLYSDITTPKPEIEETKNEVLTFGIESEPLIRKTFALSFPEYDVVEPQGYKSFVRKDKRYLGATLDGLAVKKETGERYVLEIKTADIRIYIENPNSQHENTGQLILPGTKRSENLLISQKQSFPARKACHTLPKRLRPASG